MKDGFLWECATFTYIIIVHPLDGRRRLRRVLHDARQIHRGPCIDVQIWGTHQRRNRFWWDGKICVSINRGTSQEEQTKSLVWSTRVLLTYYREVHRVADGGRRGHLKLVRPRVPLLRVPHLGRRMAQGQRGNGAWIQSVGLTCKDQSSVCGLWILWNRRSEVYVCFPVVSRWMSR